MHSKNKKPMTNAERAHVDQVRNLGCSVCDAEGPSEAHEIDQGNWWLAVALCPDCHRGSFNGLHGQRRMWLVKHMGENDALGVTIQRLVEQRAMA